MPKDYYQRYRTVFNNLSAIIDSFENEAIGAYGEDCDLYLDLLPTEGAEAYQALVDELKFTQEEAAVIVGVKRSTFAELLRINGLPDHIKDECRKSDVPKSTLIQVA